MNNMKQAKWDRRMLNVAREVASWSKDPDRKVGCVITTMDYYILSTGYNGYPKFANDIDLNGKLYKMIHAEINAVLRLPIKGGPFRVFIYGGHPCAQCAAVLLQVGCEDFVIPKIPADSKWIESMVEARELIHFQGCLYSVYNSIEEVYNG